MKKKLLLIILIINACLLSAQSNLDSLWGVWNDKSLPDSSRLLAMHRIAWDGYLFSQPDSAFFYAQLEYNYAKSKGLKDRMGNALGTQAVSFQIKGESDSAIKYFQKGLEIDREMDDKKGIVISLSNIGNIYNEQGNYPKALEYYNESLEMSRGLKKVQNAKAATLSNIGVIHSEQGDYLKSLKYSEESLAIYEENNDQRGIAYVTNNIGNNYMGLKKDSMALRYFQKGLKVNRSIGDQNGVAISLNAISSVYHNFKDYSSAIDSAQKSLKISYDFKNQTLISSNLNLIGVIYNKRGESKKAIKYCLQAYEASAKGNFMAKSVDACQCLYDAYKTIGNNKLALKYYEKKTELQDSLFNEENTKKLTRLEMQYDFDKKEAVALAEQERKDAIAAQELKRQKMMRNGFSGGFAIVLLFASIFFVQRNRIGKEKERSEELLLNILPAETAKELKDKGHSDAQLIDQVTVLFTDFKGFTALSEELTPKELVEDLHKCFSAFDKVCEKYGIEKIKTIGDAYMAAGGLPTPNKTHAEDVVNAALEMAIIVENGKAEKIAKDQSFFEVRIGVHTGPVVAGIVGIKKFQYDIWGDTVNTASRMESSGEVGKVNISETTYQLLKGDEKFTFKSRGKIAAKGKGEMEMFFVSK